MGLHMALTSTQDQIQTHTKSQSWKPRGLNRQTWRGPQRTTKTWGITGSELDRLSAAFHLMEQRCHSSRRASLWFLSTDAGTSRDLIADIWKRITRLQGACRLHCYSVITFESSGGLHAHIVFIGTLKVARRLRASKQFGDVIHVRRVTDPHGLFNYLGKERTPRAGYRREHILGRRSKGSHSLPGGGDRVRLSNALRRDAIDGAYVEQWRRSNARRRPETIQGLPSNRGGVAERSSSQINDRHSEESRYA
jgi:hypothetical protein